MTLAAAKKKVSSKILNVDSDYLPYGCVPFLKGMRAHVQSMSLIFGCLVPSHSSIFCSKFKGCHTDLIAEGNPRENKRFEFLDPSSPYFFFLTPFAAVQVRSLYFWMPGPKSFINLSLKGSHTDLIADGNPCENKRSEFFGP